MDTHSLQDQINQVEEQGPRAVAFFDLDGTLIAGYSIFGLAWEVIRESGKRGQLRKSGKLLRDALRQRVDGSGGNYARLVRRITAALEGLSEESIARMGENAYHNTIARSLYREAISLVEAHRAAGHHLVILTAASRYQVAPIARVLGIDEIYCTQLEVVRGRFTGQVVAPLCYGEGKAIAARGVCKRKRIALKNCWFYSDSSDDLPLLEQVGHPVAVNPSERLAREASARAWPQLRFSSRGTPRLEHVMRTLLAGQVVAAAAGVGIIGRKMGQGQFEISNRLTRILGDIGGGFAGLEFEVEGREHLRRDTPAIFTFNHQSLLDALVLAHLLRHDVVGFCKREMADKPMIGSLLRQIDTIFVDRQEKDQSAVLRRAREVLADGRSLVIAPEGTRSTLGEIQTFKHGAFYLAMKAGVPIIPIVLHNVKDALPKGGFLIRPATIRVTVLPPRYPADNGGVRNSASALEEQYSELLGRSKLAALPHRAAG